MTKRRIPLPDELLDVPKAAEESGLGTAIIRRYCESGRIIATKVGGSWVISRDAWELFLTQERRRGRPSPRSEGVQADSGAPLPVPNSTLAEANDKIMLGLIAGGLLSLRETQLNSPRIRKTSSDDLPLPKSLMLGWDYLSATFIRAAQVTEQPVGVDELYAWCAKPLSEWPFSGSFISEAGFNQTDRLIDLDLLNADNCGLTSLCEDWARSRLDARSEIDEERIMPAIRDICRTASRGQKIYTDVREFIITHPVVSESDLDEFCQDLPTGIFNLLSAEGGAYVPVPSSLTWKDRFHVCPYCGSILMPTDAIAPSGSDVCHERRCRDKRKRPAQVIEANGRVRRLINGMRRYVAEAGKSEIRLKEQLTESGIQVELWPDLDAYDLLLTFPNNQRWAIDVKDWVDPIALGLYVSRRGPSAIPNHPRWDRGFYVFPDDLKTKRPTYVAQFTEECQEILEAHGIQAMFMRDFVQECRKLAPTGRKQ